MARNKESIKASRYGQKKILVFDVETTGLEPSIDEIIQITILDGYGSELFSSYIKPVRHKIWTEAQRINGIRYDMVKSAPTFRKVRKEIQEIFNNAQLVVGYKVGFDIGFVEAAGIVVSGKRFDVMTLFVVIDLVLKRCRIQIVHLRNVRVISIIHLVPMIQAKTQRQRYTVLTA